MSLNLVVQALISALVITVGFRVGMTFCADFMRNDETIAQGRRPQDISFIRTLSMLVAACVLLLLVFGASFMVLLLFYPYIKLGGTP